MSALPVLSVDHADVTYQQAVNIIVDSGCCVHVCPPSFCKEVGFLQSSEQPPKLIAASWGNIATYGLRQVQMEVSGVPLMATFVVAAIRWPMLSATRLPEKGWQVLLDARSMQVSKAEVDIQGPCEHGLYLLRAHLLQGTASEVCHQQRVSIFPVTHGGSTSSTNRTATPAATSDAPATVPAGGASPPGMAEARGAEYRSGSPDSHSQSSGWSPADSVPMDGVPSPAWDKGAPVVPATVEQAGVPAVTGDSDVEGVGPYEQDEQAPVRVARLPAVSSEAERERHSATHIPYREWCEICVRARARGSQHRRRQVDPTQPLPDSSRQMSSS